MTTDATLHPRLRPLRPTTAHGPAFPRTPNHPSWRGVYVHAPRARTAAQRVIVKVQYVPRGSRRFASLAASTAQKLRYLERDTTLYGPEQMSPDKHVFAANAQSDPHQWRLILAPEQGHALDLTAFTRTWISHIEQDTGYRLDWLAVNHYDTPHPHSHILVRGRDQAGQEVGLKRDYIQRGMAFRAQDLATDLLGPRAQQREQTRACHQEQEVERDR